MADNAFEVPAALRQPSPDWAPAATRDTALAFDQGRGILPLRIRELAAVVALAFLGDRTLGEHMRRTLAAGASVREIAEALFAVSTPGGQACLTNGLHALDEIVKELGEAALEPPARSVKARTSREISPASLWPWFDERYSEYQATRRELNELTFMPAEASLEPKYAEILVAVVLCCRSYPSVMQHLRRAVAEGATLGEMVEAMNVGALVGGQAVWAHALPFLAKIREEIEAGTLKPA